MLHESQTILIVHSSHSRTHGWESDGACVDGSFAVPYNWKEFLFHRGCSFDVTSILKSGLVAGGRESKEGI